MSQHGSPLLGQLLASLQANAMMKAAAVAVDAAEMLPPEAPPQGAMPPEGMAPGGAPIGTMSQELRQKADESPDISEKQLLMDAADRFDALDQMNAPSPPPQMAPPMDPSMDPNAQMAPPPGAAPVPPPKTASARKSILEDDGNLVDFTSPGVATEKTAGDEVTAEELDGWLAT